MVLHFKKFAMKQFKIYQILTVVALLLLGYRADATHIVGGDITYKSLGNDNYEITLTLRRDCNLGQVPFDPSASIGIFDPSNNNILLKEVRVDFMASDTVGNTIVANCGFVGSQVCVQRTTYRTIVNLPVKPGGYIIAYQRCCRNESLNNVVIPLESGSTQWVHLTEAAMKVGNSSPAFINWPDVYICANTPLVFNHSAIDADGDLLVYKTCIPFDGASIISPQPAPPNNPPYSPIQWNAPYNLENMMGGTPLEINNTTGLITANPNIVGQFLIGICVEEYRNGVLLSTVRRDFQYNVRICLPPAVANFSTSKLNCDPNTITFTNNSENAVSYVWNFNYPSSDSAFTSNETNPIFEYSQAGTYIVKLTSKATGGACEGVAYDTIVIRELSTPMSPISGDTNTCGGPRDYTVSGGFFNDTKEWATDPLFANIIATGTSFTFNTTGFANTTLYVRSRSNDGCGELLQSITINDRSFFVDYNKALTICSGSETGVQISSNATTPLTYTFTDPHVVSVINGVVLIKTTTADMQPFTIMGTVANEFGCSQNVTITVTPSSASQPTIKSELVSCESRQICFTAEGNLNNLLWNFGTSMINDTSTSATPCYIFTEAGTYTVTLSSTDPNCPFTTVTTIVEVPKQSSNLAVASELKSCDKGEVCFSLTGTVVGQISWNFGDPNSGSNNTSTANAPCHVFSVPGTYKVTLTNTNAPCPNKEVVQTVVVPEKLVLSPLGDLTICEGSTISLQGPNIPGITLQWCRNGVVVGSGSSTDVLEPGNYLLKATNAQGCTDSTGFKVDKFTFNYTIESPSVICAGENYLVKTNLSDQDNYLFTWGPVECIVSGINSPQALVLASTDKTITLTLTSKAFGCVSTKTVNTDVQSAAAGTITGNFCNGQPSNLNLTIANAANYTFDWSPKDMIVSGANTANPVVNITSNKTFTVVITDKTTNCETVLTYNAVVNPLLTVAFNPPTVEINQGKDAELNIKDPLAGATYKWSTNETGTSITVDPIGNASYTVTVTDANGCTGTGVVNVVVRTVNCTEKDEYLPNAFTPNGDTKNDVLLVRSNVIEELEFVIYNRWGQEVFKSMDINVGWDGTCDGKELKPDAYAYYIKATCLNGDSFIKKGNVTLLR
jgi:gliding motility-associated-like protein